MTLATEQGFAQWVAWGTVLHGWALAMQGQGEAGLAQIRQGLAADLATGSTMWQPYRLGLLAEAYGAGGHPRQGCRRWPRREAVMDTTEVRWWEAEVSRLQGVLLLQQAGPGCGAGGNLFPAGPRRGPPPAGQIAGAARRHEPGPAVAAAGQAGRSL